MNVAPLFSVLYIVGHYLLLYGRTNNVVKRRAALGFAACQSKKVLPAWFASVDADIRIGRRRHPYRSAQTSVSVGADIRIGRRSHPTPSPRSRLRGYSRDAIPSYRLRGYSRDAIPSYRLRGYGRDAIPSYRLRGYGRDAIPSYR